MVIVRNSLKTDAAVKVIVATVKEHKPRSYAGFLGNFAKLITACQAIGIPYDPDNPMLAITELILLLATITNTNKKVVDLLTPYKAALLARNYAYELMSAYKTQILNALKASKDVTPEQVLIAVNYGKKVDGIRIKSIKILKGEEAIVETEVVETATNEVELERVEHNSVSFQRFEIRMNNFFIFYKYVTGLDCYSPKKEMLQLAAIQEYYDSLAGLNSEAQLATNAMVLARQTRDVAFFDEKTGARHIGTQVKDYISGDFTTKSKEYKMVKGLAFIDLRRKNDK